MGLVRKGLGCILYYSFLHTNYSEPYITRSRLEWLGFQWLWNFVMSSYVGVAENSGYLFFSGPYNKEL